MSIHGLLPSCSNYCELAREADTPSIDATEHFCLMTRNLSYFVPVIVVFCGGIGSA